MCVVLFKCKRKGGKEKYLNPCTKGKCRCRRPKKKLSCQRKENRISFPAYGGKGRRRFFALMNSGKSSALPVLVLKWKSCFLCESHPREPSDKAVCPGGTGWVQWVTCGPVTLSSSQGTQNCCDLIRQLMPGGYYIQASQTRALT